VNLPRPTIGRILLYSYSPVDHVIGLGDRVISRPCIVASVRPANSELGTPESYAIVVFTAGLDDFQQGRTGFAGTLSRTGIELHEKPTPGGIHWPERT
jgi:hypothetical protein